MRLYRGGWGIPAAGIDPIEPGSESPAPGSIIVPVGSPRTFSASLLTPTGGTLAVSWLVDGVLQSAGVTSTPTATSFQFNGIPGSHSVTLNVRDTTLLANPTMAGATLQSVRTWTVDGGPSADLGVAVSANRTSTAPGDLLSFAVAVSNSGPDAAVGSTVTVAWPGSMPSLGWTCTASAGSSCPASGTGTVSHAVDLLPGGTLAYSASGTVPLATTTLLVMSATAGVPSGVFELVPGNNASWRSPCGSRNPWPSTPSLPVVSPTPVPPPTGPRSPPVQRERSWWRASVACRRQPLPSPSTSPSPRLLR